MRREGRGIGANMNGDRFTTAIQMVNGLLKRGNWFIWISSQRFGRREMILWSMRLRLVNEFEVERRLKVLR
jgi:hypothetical protein